MEDVVSPQPKISILSAIYNEERHLQEMIDSVKGQSYENWELVLIDDDSTDATVSIANKAAADDSRIIVRSGYGKLKKVGAFNKAFELSSGSYVVLLGGDDTLPVNSLASRITALSGQLSEDVCGYFRLKTLSDDRRYDGMVLPKKKRGNRSGGTLIMSRTLGNKMFPIPNDFVAEDIWLSEMVNIHAKSVIDSPEVVLNYRIHPGNSNPRNRPFEQMNESMHLRMAPYRRILDQEECLDGESQRRLTALVELEDLRYQGETVEILRHSGASIVARLRTASMSDRVLYSLRNRFYSFFSGWS